MAPSDPLPLVCPACGRSPVKGLVPSARGVYCRCEFCGHMWQEKGLRITWRSRPANQSMRRKTDRTAHKSGARRRERSFVDLGAIPCPHCDQIDDERERHLQQLTRRTAELEAENALLRDSARSFGELAERLNQQLREERKTSRANRRERSKDKGSETDK